MNAWYDLHTFNPIQVQIPRKHNRGESEWQLDICIL